MISSSLPSRESDITLPVAAILPDLLAALAAGGTAVLVAPPGAGKTTLVAPALLDEGWAAGKRILLLSPRRLAARAAAERMAALAGESVGRTIGYRTRMDSRVGPHTRIEVLTEGIFTRMIQDDPELTGIAAVLFDEVHERSLDGDLGLALALDVRTSLRPDLRLVAMSATMDGAAYARLLDAPVIVSDGRAFPVELRYRGRDTGRIEDAMAAAIHRAVDEEPGSILAFLPGAAEIERTAERLRLPADMAVHTLYGALDGAVQRAAIEPAPPGRRKVVLATSIAETSLTIDGVRVVIDSGLARRPRYDRATGLTRLVTERATQAAVTQRAGRAGRTAPGVAWRLWEEAATTGLPRFDPPAMTDSDLTGLVLDLALWGVTDPATLAWLDPPPRIAVSEAQARLADYGALDHSGALTAHGRAMAALPVPPALAQMLLIAGAHGLGSVAAEVAVLLGERGLGGRDADLETRRRNWARERGQRATAARALAGRWARLVGGGDGRDIADATARAIAFGYPERIARRRGAGDGTYLMANGRAVRLDPADPLAKAEWLAVADASGAADGARVLAAAALDAGSVRALFGDRIERRAGLVFDPVTRSVSGDEVERLGAIVLARRPAIKLDPAAVTVALMDGVRSLGLDSLPWTDEATAFRARVAFLRARGEVLPDLSDATLLDTIEVWLGPLLDGKRRLDALDPTALTSALTDLLDWPQRQLLEKKAPARFTTPAGSSHSVDYAADPSPAVAVRVQALFGLDTHPSAGGTPLVLHLLSPAQRPIQTTRDLPGFWRGSWAAVKAEMKGRYPATTGPIVRGKRRRRCGPSAPLDPGRRLPHLRRMKARIHPSTKSSTQSGRARTKRWLLSYESEDRQRLDPLTGWTGSADTQAQVTLAFDDLDSAVAYATAKGIDYDVVQPGTETLKLQAYADNFR